MGNYVYIRSESNLWTVGFYDSNGRWHPESDWAFKEEAAERVSFLNGYNYIKKNTYKPYEKAKPEWIGYEVKCIKDNDFVAEIVAVKITNGDTKDKVKLNVTYGESYWHTLDEMFLNWKLLNDSPFGELVK